MRVFRYIAIALVFCAASTLRAATPATQPADDGLVSGTVAAADTGTLIEWRKSLSDRAAASITDLKNTDVHQLARIALFREFAGFFGRITDPTENEKATIKWLAAQPHLMPTLMAAVSSQDPPDDLLRLLTALKNDQGGKLDDYPDLATAFLIVWDKVNEEAGSKSKINIATAVRLYHYFINSKILHFNPRELPWQLAVYVVNVKISELEILWAIDRYARRDQIGSVYFEVNYDTQSYIAGTAGKISGHDYTLQNIVKFGGVCIDQAYFATQVAKVVGVPSCICTGQGGAGTVGHAWVGYLQVLNNGVAWNFNEGRYKEDLFWAANITDPQTQENISDADVALLGELARIDPAARLESAALAKLADLGDPSIRLQLLTRAIDLSPGNRPAWKELAKLGAGHQLTEAQINSITDVVSKRVAQPYPQFACNFLMKMASAGELEKQIAALDKIAVTFKARPDLVATVRIEQGDRLHKAGKNDLALIAYCDVLNNELEAGPIISQAMRHVDEILRETHNLRRLAEIYKQTFNRMLVPDASAYVSETPYYRLGQDYAGVLDQLGQANEAMGVRSRIQALSTNIGTGRTNF